MFLQKVVTLLGVFEGSVTKSTSLFQRGNLAQWDGPAIANHRYLIILESEPYHARSMFREKQMGNASLHAKQEEQQQKRRK